MAGLRCPLVIGRGEELAALRSALAAARAGAGGVVFLAGEPGIGKSRLASELTTAARVDGVTVLAGRAVPSDTSSPYRPLTEALLQALRARPLPSDAGLAPWLGALHAVIPAALPAPGAGHGDHRVAEHGPAVRGEAVLQLLRRLGGPGGLLIVLEDLHWADPDTLAVLDYLADNLGREPVLCVATSRSEPGVAAADLMTRLHHRGAAVLVELGRLSRDEVADMVRACLPEAEDDVITRVQQVADGIPFLVEEVLAGPGVPTSFAEAVRARMAELSEDQRLVLHTAALFGRQFDWQMLPAATGLAAEVIARALERAVASQLLISDGDVFRFRHMLTREAVVAELLPPRRVALAARALVALETARPGRPDSVGDVAADLAVQAGDTARAGSLLTASGRSALARGALATAVDTLRRAAQLVIDPDRRAEAETLLVESLTLAGRVDEAMQVGERLIDQLAAAGPSVRAALHLRLAHAAVDGTRWSSADRHLRLAGDLLAGRPEPRLTARAAVLEAEVEFAAGHVGRAGELAEKALASAGGSAEVRCHALELLGRLRRANDLDAARDAFDRALVIADAAGLAVWRLRALHELGTIDLFDHAGSERLARARRMAGEQGAASTGALIDLQLTAAAVFRFELGGAERHAKSALAVSTRLGLSQLRGVVLVFLAEVHALRRDRAGMERYIALARAAAPGDPEIEGSALAGARGMRAVLDDDMAAALADLGRGIELLDTLPQQGPAPYRGLWPLLLAAQGDERAAAAIGHARDIGLTVNRANRGLLGYADAIAAGRSGQPERATALAMAADADLVHFPVWADLARLWAAEPARADGWGMPAPWLEAAAGTFARHRIEPLARRCRRLLAEPQPSRWARLGITDREADVLRLVVAGSSNKEIAARLYLSPRTVEKHVENLLRKTGSRSRTQLMAAVGREPG